MYYSDMYFTAHKLLILVFSLGLLCILVVVFNILAIKLGGTPVAVPDIPRQPQAIGQGGMLTYAVLGDSTAVGQGGQYDKGIAVETAHFLANKGYRVRMHNFAVSGSRVADVLHKQATPAADIRPDVVLLAVGANDVTHLSRLSDVRRDMLQIIHKLQAANPTVKIIMTGSPEMGSVPRFVQPTKWLAKVRTKSINNVFDQIAREKGALRAPIAETTGPIFMKHPELFASDKFHPLDAGYAVWLPVLNHSLEQIIAD